MLLLENRPQGKHDTDSYITGQKASLDVGIVEILAQEETLVHTVQI